jgi:uncharacterized phage-associated protein
MSRSKPDKTIIVAHYLMSKSKKAKRHDFTNKKLQKLMFYSQAWSLVLNDKKLIDDKFEAWIHGAAISSLYGRYKKYGFNQIEEEFDESEFDKLAQEEKDLLDTVWSVYGKYDPDYLEVLNHSEEPWQKARQHTSPLKSSNTIISEDEMKRYYGEKLKEAKAKS